MTNFAKLLAAAAAAGAIAAPAAAQNYQYPQQYPQSYQQYPQTYQQQYPQTYPGTGYGYQQGYGAQQGYSQNPISSIINQLLGNRYNVTDRQAVSQCATAAMAQAQSQYRGNDQGYGGYNNYQQGYGYQQNIAAPAMRVTAITDVQRRTLGLRVKGLISSGYSSHRGYNGYQSGAYAAGDLSFRCNVDYRGQVTNVRISRNANAAYRGY